jgi:hypothetical protein
MGQNTPFLPINQALFDSSTSGGYYPGELLEQTSDVSRGRAQIEARLLWKGPTSLLFSFVECVLHADHTVKCFWQTYTLTSRSHCHAVHNNVTTT